jgi:Beta-lactamase enzyme family
MINSPVDKEKVTTSPPEPPVSTDKSVSQPSSTSIKNLVMTIGILITASLSGYFGLMLIHKALLPPTTAPIASPLKPVSTSPTAKSSEPLASNVQTKIQPTEQTHQIALTFKNTNGSLDRAINKITEHCKRNGLSTDSLSISLVNLKTGELAGYRNKIERYPASVVKVFWLFKAYNNDPMIYPKLRPAMAKMILKSDNNGASEVLDRITETKSSKTELLQPEFEDKQRKRKSLNEFYQKKGYSPSLNISQKTFPITDENIMEPQGFDKQLRGKDIQQPVRNKITTDDATLLMSEIIKNPNQEMRKLLTRNIDPNFWRKQPPNPIEFNPVESFFGAGLEGLGSKVISKAGWTSASRQEVAYIKSKDGKTETEYILTVFGDSADYAKNKKIFPEISKLVYKEMQDLSKNKPMN